MLKTLEAVFIEVEELFEPSRPIPQALRKIAKSKGHIGAVQGYNLGPDLWVSIYNSLLRLKVPPK